MLLQFQITYKLLIKGIIKYRRIVLAVHNLDELETFMDDAHRFPGDAIELLAVPLLASVN